MVAVRMADAESGRICYTFASRTFQYGENEMKLTRMVLTGGLLLVLAGCGNDSPVVTPPTPTPTPTPGAGSLAGTVTAPTTDGDVSNTVVFACYNNALPACVEISGGVFTDGYSSAALVSQSGSTGAYSIDNLQAVQFSLIAAKDSDGNGSLEDAGDYFGIYLASGATDISLVTPPQTGLTIPLVDVVNLQSTATNDGITAKALRAAESLLKR